MKNIFYIFIIFFFFGKGLSSQNFEKLKYLADSLFSEGKYKNSIPAYTKMLVIQPKNLATLYNRSFAYLYSKEYSKAIADADKGLTFKPTLFYEDAFNRIKGFSFYDEGKYEKAIEFLSEYVAVNLQAYDSYLARGIAYYEIGKYEKAILDLKYSLQDRNILKEDKLFAISKIGACYLKLDSTLQVHEILEKLKKIDSTYNRTEILSAQILDAKKDYSKALQLYNNAYNSDTTNLEVLEKIAYCNYNLKQYDNAIDQYKKYLNKVPKSSETCNMISWIMFFQKKYKEAIEFANKAILYDKLNSNAYDTRGCILYKTNQCLAAITDFDHSLKIDPTSANSHYYRGLCYLKTNKIKEACNNWNSLNGLDYKPVDGEEQVIELIKKHCK